MFGILKMIRELRKAYVKHLSLPRTARSAVKSVETDINPSSGLYNFNHSRPQPWYVKPSVWKSWGMSGLLTRAIGGRVPGSAGDKYHPKGYDLWTIGPQPQQGKGIEDMKSNIELLKSRGLDRCPFSRGLDQQ